MQGATYFHSFLLNSPDWSEIFLVLRTFKTCRAEFIEASVNYETSFNGLKITALEQKD